VTAGANSTPARSLARALLAAVARRQPRRISAMLRVRDEEESLAAAVRSIADLVDEIVIVDNLSDDRTPEIVRGLAGDYSGKLLALRYDHPVAAIGVDSVRLAESPEGRRSPALSANFYEWCRRRLRHPFALKWDGDMVALPAFAETLARWRAGRAVGVVFGGANLHPDRCHVAAPRTTEREALLARLASDGLPRWATGLGRDALEPRLFPRRLCRYTPRIGWTQSLDGLLPLAQNDPRLWQIEEAPQYIHLKFCKREPFRNYSRELAEVIGGNLVAGAPIPESWERLLASHDLAARRAS
jgi:hypothetical protein